MIPSRIHGVIDYAVGLLLIAAPWLLGFATGGPAQWVTVALGAGAIVYSALTRYELGLVPLLPYRVHLAIDLAFAALLLVSPWLFGFADVIRWPHVLIGALAIGVVLLSRRRTSAGSGAVAAHRR